MKDPYQTLGVARTSSDAEIKKAYRKLAKELHPDRNRDNPRSTDRFKEVTAAYDFLSDPEKRRKFDAGEIDASGNPTMPFGYGQPGGGQPGFGPGGQEFHFSGSPEDIFQDLFGARGFDGAAQARRAGGNGRRGFQRRGQDINYSLDIDFLDAGRGAEKTLSLQGGKNLKVKIPAGLKSGQQIRLAGQGGAGVLGGGDGDALITVTVRDHPFFSRDGDDLKLDLPISLDEAVLGAKVKVPTLEGAVMLTIPKGASSGRVLRLPQKGFAAGHNRRGDLLVRLEIVLPDDQDGALAAAIEPWAKTHGYRVRTKMGLD